MVCISQSGFCVAYLIFIGENVSHVLCGSTAEKLPIIAVAGEAPCLTLRLRIDTRLCHWHLHLCEPSRPPSLSCDQGLSLTSAILVCLLVWLSQRFWRSSCHGSARCQSSRPSGLHRIPHHMHPGNKNPAPRPSCCPEPMHLTPSHSVRRCLRAPHSQASCPASPPPCACSIFADVVNVCAFSVIIVYGFLNIAHFPPSTPSRGSTTPRRARGGGVQL